VHQAGNVLYSQFMMHSQKNIKLVYLVISSSFSIRPSLYRHYLPYTDTTFLIQTLPSLYRHYLPYTDTTFLIQTLPSSYRHYHTYVISSCEI